MSAITRFVLERSAFAALPLLGLVVWNFMPAPAGTPAPATNPWAAPAPTMGQDVATLVAGLGQDLGIGAARAAGGEAQSATFAYEKARIASVYAAHGYRQAETARALGTDVSGLRQMLRGHGIIEWPEGHRDL